MLSRGYKTNSRSTTFIACGLPKDGTLFDTSLENDTTFGKFDQQRAVQGGYEPIPFQAGKKME
jgi:peptidylprolyl isomerase